MSYSVRCAIVVAGDLCKGKCNKSSAGTGIRVPRTARCDRSASAAVGKREDHPAGRYFECRITGDHRNADAWSFQMEMGRRAYCLRPSAPIRGRSDIGPVSKLASPAHRRAASGRCAPTGRDRIRDADTVIWPAGRSNWCFTEAGKDVRLSSHGNKRLVRKCGRPHEVRAILSYDHAHRLLEIQT